MIKRNSALLLLFAIGQLSAGASPNRPPDRRLVLTFFGSPACEQCMEIKTKLLQPLEAKYAADLHIDYRNIEDSADYKVCISMEKGYGVKETSPQELFFPDTMLAGYDAITGNGKALIESYIAHPEKGVYRHAYGDTALDTVSADRLLGRQKELDSICSTYVLPFCNGSTIADGIKKRCFVAPRFYDFAKWLVFKGKDRRECVNDLDDRVHFLTSDRSFEIDVRNMPVAGDLQSPASIVIYLSATCPLCKYLASALFEEVTRGDLKGKAKLVAKPFTETIGDRALLAANRHGRFWDMVVALNARKERPNERMVVKIADSLGIAVRDFRKALNDTAIAGSLTRIRDEGVKNGVTLTPTLFINGKRYHSYKDPRWVVDAVRCLEEMQSGGGPKSPH